ncbi:MAG TPA: Asp-tRNA(Asn)/Glu-tRNA(Gln) amidotransferase subunit GatA [Chitinophagaceae bacterium]|nr:Asp-tRNA(Asn)/Glu-tRNA(Gln) amidotransferase subunit GatA [Chitinophagaceae bacterium]
MHPYSSIQAFHNALDDNSISCEATVNHFLHAIEQQKHLNAFIEVYKDECIIRAKELDKKLALKQPKGKLFGVVIGIKDVICYKGHTSTASSNILKNFQSIYSSTAVEKLLKEDAIIIGSLNCDEFAMGSTNENSVYGNVLNALDTTRVSGGSSGGSAVAVQAGLCMVSLGSDTGGSVRQPADFCGIVGLKPTYGRVSRYGLIAYASSFDQIGILGRNIEDVAIVLEVISGVDNFDSTVSASPVPNYLSLINHPVNNLKIAYFKEALEHPGLDPEIGNSIKQFIASLKKDGYTIDSVDFDYLDYIVPTYYVLTTAEASSNLSRYDGIKYGYSVSAKDLDLVEFYKKNRSQGFGKEVKRRIMLGTFVLSAGYYDFYFTKAQQVRQLLIETTDKIYNNYDAIIMPTVPTTAFKIGEKINDPIAMYIADIYTVFANLVGIPGISIPLFKHSNNMPFGLQILTKRFDELSLLQLSHQWMQRYKTT